MSRFLAGALALGLTFVTSAAAAQTTIVIESPPPPTVIVVIEPPPPPVVILETPPEPHGAPSVRPRFIVDLRGDLLLGAGYEGPALGGSAMGGFMFGEGVSAQLALGYASAMGWGPNEVNLGVEVQRDFSPLDPAGFLLVGRVGTAFLLGERDLFDSGIRLSGQLGIGGRFGLSPDVAITMDLRGVLRFRPDAPFGPTENDLGAGVLMTMGVRIRM